MSVLVIAPHPDDESIGCGGALCRHTDAKQRVVAVFLTSGELGLKHLPREEAWRIREGEAMRAATVLNLAELFFLRQPDWFLNKAVKKSAAALAGIISREAPDTIYLPHPGEWHPDHKAALPILRAAAKSLRTKELALRGYEVWTPLTDFAHVENVTDVMARKLRAVRAHRSQFSELDYAHAVRGLNAYRGALAGRCRFAEVFQELSL
jgi:LmbE family N-acetylglucosaminyl deacetylase